MTCEYLLVVDATTTNTVTGTGNNGLSGGNYAVLEDSDDATVIVPRPLQVQKTASGTYTRNVQWSLTKEVDPAVHDGFVGQVAGESTYTIVATKANSFSGYEVTGSITITNSNPFAVELDSVEDPLADIISCVDAAGAFVSSFPYEMDAGATIECT